MGYTYLRFMVSSKNFKEITLFFLDIFNSLYIDIEYIYINLEIFKSI